MTASQIARTAADLVSGDRAINHGAKLPNHQKIADVWNGILKAAGKAPIVALDAHDVANMMEGLKIARRYCGAFNADDYIDGAGYAACAGEIKAQMIHNDQSWADAAKTKVNRR
jgi:stage V sporulation protein SpoVS